MKKHLVHLEKSLIDNDYTSEQIRIFCEIVEQLSLTGRAVACNTYTHATSSETGDKIIHSAGVQPLFKQNSKSTDVYLNTIQDLNVIRVHHPDNKFHTTKYGIHVGNRKDIAKPYSDRTKPVRGFSF